MSVHNPLGDLYLAVALLPGVDILDAPSVLFSWSCG